MFKCQANTTLSTFELNNIMAVFTKKHLCQIMMYYLDKDKLFFVPNQVIDGSNEKKHIFTFGEIVVNSTNGNEVVVVREYETTLEYVTHLMLNTEDDYIIPKIENKKLYECATIIKRYAVDCDDVASL